MRERSNIQLSAFDPEEFEVAVRHGVTPFSRHLSPWSMFLAADIVVKVVMVSLAFARS
jgi:hypothetical protein